MRYLYKRGIGASRRVMHIAEHDMFGNVTMRPICGDSRIDYNTTINAPFALKRPICKRCKKKYAELKGCTW